MVSLKSMIMTKEKCWIKNFILIIVFLIFQFSFGQVQDTTKIEPVFMRNRFGSTTISNNLRLGIGFHNYFQSEIGYSRMQFTTSCTGFFGKTYYSSLEYLPKTENYKPVYGLKIGIDYNLSILAVGLETKYQTNFDEKDFVIAPKIGLGLGLINAFYGYNISLNDRLPNTNKHFFSIVANIPITSK